MSGDQGEAAVLALDRLLDQATVTAGSQSGRERAEADGALIRAALLASHVGCDGEFQVIKEVVSAVSHLNPPDTGMSIQELIGWALSRSSAADLHAQIAALTAANDDLRDRLDAIEAACDDADRRGQMLGSQAVRRLVRGTR